MKPRVKRSTTKKQQKNERTNKMKLNEQCESIKLTYQYTLIDKVNWRERIKNNNPPKKLIMPPSHFSHHHYVEENPSTHLYVYEDGRLCRALCKDAEYAIKIAKPSNFVYKAVGKVANDIIFELFYIVP